jgi:hypothetical protein
VAVRKHWRYFAKNVRDEREEPKLYLFGESINRKAVHRVSVSHLDEVLGEHTLFLTLNTVETSYPSATNGLTGVYSPESTKPKQGSPHYQIPKPPGGESRLMGPCSSVSSLSASHTPGGVKRRKGPLSFREESGFICHWAAVCPESPKSRVT